MYFLYRYHCALEGLNYAGRYYYGTSGYMLLFAGTMGCVGDGGCVQRNDTAGGESDGKLLAGKVCASRRVIDYDQAIADE